MEIPLRQTAPSSVFAAHSAASDGDGSVQVPDPKQLWDPATLAGRLVEITAAHANEKSPMERNVAAGRAANIWDIAAPRDVGSAAMTTAAGLLWKAQQRGEPAAWISARASIFFPPDLEAGGIDLAALIVVRAPDAATAARAADKLLRCGAFGLVLLDLGEHAALPAPLLTRLLGLAQKHQAAVVFLTEKADDAPSLAPIISLRVSAMRRRTGVERFSCSVEARKDKRSAPGWSVEEQFCGPPGLR